MNPPAQKYHCIIIGSGRRVRETALPAFLAAGPAFQIAGVFARTPKTIETGGRTFAVRALAEARALAGKINFVYVAVGKKSVADVARRLLDMGFGSCTLLIDTPVLLIKHLRHLPLLQQFRESFVAEDCIALPWYETARRAAGRIERIEFHQSAYAYHAFAMGKALAGADAVVSARVEKGPGGSNLRNVIFNNGARMTVVDPRDYSKGRFVVHGAASVISDRPAPGENYISITPKIMEDRFCGIRCGTFETAFDDATLALTGGSPAPATLTAGMETLKRAGFLQLLNSIAAGRGGYSLISGIEDMLVDYWLMRRGRYAAGGVMDIRNPRGRVFYRLLSQTVGRFF